MKTVLLVSLSLMGVLLAHGCVPEEDHIDQWLGCLTKGTPLSDPPKIEEIIRQCKRAQDTVHCTRNITPPCSGSVVPPYAISDNFVKLCANHGIII